MSKTLPELPALEAGDIASCIAEVDDSGEMYG